MKALASIFFASSLSLAVHPGPARASDQLFREPESSSAPLDLRTIERVEAALSKYADFCSAHDDAAYSLALTDDALIEYAAEAEGHYLAADILFSECWSVAAQLSGSAQAGAVWIYPSGLANTVFIQYGSGPSEVAGSGHPAGIALIQMQGARIERIRVFSRE